MTATLPPAPDQTAVQTAVQTPNHAPDPSRPAPQRRLRGGAVPGAIPSAVPGGPSGLRLTAMGHRAALLGLSPVLLGQGLWTRIKTPVLPEPPGARSGSVGQGRRLRLLIAGDSAAAGVGVDHQSQALSGQIAALMAPICRLDWRLLAQRGWRSRDLIAQLRGLGDDRFDVALLSLGVNDVTGGVGRAAFLRAQQDLADLLADRFGIRLFWSPPCRRWG
ncbi:GDSL-type esterase/lipase family protein [Paracoccus jiaweipingae]|uniref:GDSL-type esterase/lipase family protein n=1 Tax=Paracoccus sp. p2-l61 TaxID=3366950 RepID=UPI0037BA5383